MTAIQLEALQILSREIIGQLELRRSIDILEQAVLDQEKYVELMHEYQRDMEKVRIQLEAQSVTDVLTGVDHRRSFDLKLEEEYLRARRSGSALSLLMIDIDHFKGFNDDFGHPVGDETLRSVAHLLQSELRAHDFLYRYGGEEFSVILPAMTSKGAFVLGERFRRTVQRAPWKKRAITISIGAASLDENMTSPADLVEAADRAPYRAKESGRNRICTSADET